MTDLKAEVDLLNDKWGELMRAKDVNGLAEMYTEDCKYMPPNSPVIEGKEGVKKVYEGFFEAGAADGKLVSNEVGPSGDSHVFMRGVYDVYKADGSELEKGKMVMIFKRVNGKLLIYIDIDNTF
ncbi:uncharacterized protein [Amphiura filiformis]|uniref:uncharacterized protein isoform X1 n=1 Tax=Amphiura filiformis TaxID=82378 RepID=UPI003B21753C